MKRKIKNLIVKIQEYCKLHEKKVIDVVFYCSMIVGAVIWVLIGFKFMEPKKMANSDIAYCKERIEKISKNEFWKSVAVINQLEKNGYDVEIDYENSEIIVSYADENSEEIIFQKTKNEDISLKKHLSDARNMQIFYTLGTAFIGVVGGPVVFLIILVIWCAVCYIIEWILKIAEKIKELIKK